MFASHVPKEMGLLFELPVASGALEAGLHTTFVLNVVLQPFSGLVEAATAGTLVRTEKRDGVQ